jgi:hypothetical protein
VLQCTRNDRIAFACAARYSTLVALTTFAVQSPAMAEMQPPPPLPKSCSFILLAVVMFVTRKVDWYARDAG